MKGFAASPMGTATPHENQKIETTHVGASKQAFCAKLPQIFKKSVATTEATSTFSYESFS